MAGMRGVLRYKLQYEPKMVGTEYTKRLEKVFSSEYFKNPEFIKDVKEIKGVEALVDVDNIKGYVLSPCDLLLIGKVTSNTCEILIIWYRDAKVSKVLEEAVPSINKQIKDLLKADCKKTGGFNSLKFNNGNSVEFYPVKKNINGVCEIKTGEVIDYLSVEKTAGNLKNELKKLGRKLIVVSFFLVIVALAGFYLQLDAAFYIALAAPFLIDMIYDLANAVVAGKKESYSLDIRGDLVDFDPQEIVKTMSPDPSEFSDPKM